MSVVMFLLALMALVGGISALTTVVRSPASIWVFLAGWLPSEHPWHFVLGQLLLVLIFQDAVAANSLTLPLFISAWLCLAMAWERSRRAPDDLTRALQQGLPAAAADLAVQVPWRDLVLPIQRLPATVTRTRNIPYCSPQPRDKGQRNLLDIYQPRGMGARRDGQRGAPVLLQVHGGAWLVGDKNTQALPLLHHMASNGWLCFSQNYRLSPQATWPDHVVDVKRAIAWIRANAAAYGGDPGFICITGGSAGGQLSALAALTANSPEFQPGFEQDDTRLAAAVPFYGAVDLLDDSGHVGTDLPRFMVERILQGSWPLSADSKNLLAAASPLRRIHPQAPPTMLIQGSKDSLVPVAAQRHFAAALAAGSQQPVVYAELPGAEHAFDLSWSLRSLATRQAVRAFLDHIHARYLTGNQASAMPEQSPEQSPDELPEDIGHTGIRAANAVVAQATAVPADSTPAAAPAAPKDPVAKKAAVKKKSAVKKSAAKKAAAKTPASKKPPAKKTAAKKTPVKKAAAKKPAAGKAATKKAPAKKAPAPKQDADPDPTSQT